MGAPVDYRMLIINTANRYGVPPEIALAVAAQESGVRQWDTSGNVIRGSSGEVGMFQLMPETAAEVGVDPYDVNQNIEGGVRYLANMKALAGDWPGALLAYNGGPGTYQSKGKGGYADSYAAASRYSQEVLARAGRTSTGQNPGQMPVIPIQQPGWGDWLSMVSPDPVYNTGTVFSTDVVGDASARLGWLVLAAGLAAAVVITR